MEQDNNTMTGNDILKQEAFVFEKVVVDIHCKPVLPGVHYKQKLKNNSFVLLYWWHSLQITVVVRAVF